MVEHVAPPPQAPAPLQSTHCVPVHWMVPSHDASPRHRTVQDGTPRQSTPSSQDSSPHVTSQAVDDPQSIEPVQPSTPEQSTLQSKASPQSTPKSQELKPQMTAHRTRGGQVLRAAQTSRPLQSSVQTFPTHANGAAQLSASHASGPPASKAPASIAPASTPPASTRPASTGSCASTAALSTTLPESPAPEPASRCATSKPTRPHPVDSNTSELIHSVRTTVQDARCDRVRTVVLACGPWPRRQGTW